MAVPAGNGRMQSFNDFLESFLGALAAPDFSTVGALPDYLNLPETERGGDEMPVVFQTWISYQNPKFISVDKQANNDVMHFVEFGETNRLSD
jgi:hypothetical protein